MKQVDLDALDGLMVDPDAERTGHVGIAAAAAVSAAEARATARPATLDDHVVVRGSALRRGVVAATFVIAAASAILSGRLHDLATPRPGAAHGADPVNPSQHAAATTASTPAPAPPSPSSTAPVPEAVRSPPSPTAALTPPQEASSGAAPAQAAPVRAASPGAAPIEGTLADGARAWTVHFAFGSTTPALEEFYVARSGSRSCTSDLIVTGFTCDVGNFAYNMDLAVRRSQAVAQMLVQAGVPSDRIRTRGAPPERALNPHDRRASRRVEIVCQPNHER